MLVLSEGERKHKPELLPGPGLVLVSGLHGVSFAYLESCFSSLLCIHEPKIATQWTHLRIVGGVLTTNVLQISLGQLLFRPTLKDRLGSCLSLLSK